MVTPVLIFFTVNEIGSYLFLTRGSSGIVIMSRSLKAISGTQLVLCVHKRFVCFNGSRKVVNFKVKY